MLTTRFTFPPHLEYLRAERPTPSIYFGLYAAYKISPTRRAGINRRFS